MATVMRFTGGLFSFRLFVKLYERLLHDKRHILGLILEIHYLLVSAFYTGLFFWSVDVLSTGVEAHAGAIIGVIVSILGMFGLSYAIFDYHKFMGNMGEYRHYGYTATAYGSTVRVREDVRHKLTHEAFMAVLWAPLGIVIRFVNLIIVCVRTLRRGSEHICDLSYRYCHPQHHSPTKMIFVDVIAIADVDWEE
ncbi:MAG: hypothetical protein IJX70_02950 [Clostridia bacterium]|nr:hypothetical protein [Clostridia bacterium]